MPEPGRGLLARIERFSMPAGPVRCRGSWLRQQGEMRFAPDRPWLPFEAEEWFLGSGIDFRWRAKVRVAPLLAASVVDTFQGGRGRLTARILGVFPVARSRGETTDNAEALRGLAEAPWRPFVFRAAPPLSWEESAPDRLLATFDEGGIRVAVEFHVDADGRVLGGTAPSRPRLVGKSVVETPWSGSFAEYRTFDGLRVPTLAEVSWHLPEGAFTYWRGRVTEFRVLT